MAASPEYTVRSARREDMKGLLDLTLDEGWNNSLDYLENCYDLYPEGFFVAESSDGRIISHCGVTLLDSNTGFIAFYITDKPLRGQGIGQQVFERCYRSMEGRNIGLNAAWPRQDMYASGGFAISTHCISTFEVPIKSITFETARLDDMAVTILQSSEVALEEFLKYDKKIQHLERRRFIPWCLSFAHSSLVAMDRGHIVGWCTLCKAVRGFRLMPLYADSKDIAMLLIFRILEEIPKEGILEIAFPDSNIAAKQLYDEIGVTKGSIFLNRRMFTQKDLPIESSLVFSIMNYDNVLA